MSAYESVLFAGMARKDITPGTDVHMDGFGSRQGAVLGHLDQLSVKGLILTQGEFSHAFLSFDICGASEELELEMATQICAYHELPRASLTLSFTHTHAGPACGVLKDLPIDQDYWDDVITKANACLADAKQSAVPAVLRFSKSNVNFPVHRREVKDGKVILGENENGYADNSVRILSVYAKERADSKPLGFIVLASCHPTCLPGDNRYFSADYPAALYQGISETYSDAVVMFINSGAGDVAPRRLSSEDSLTQAHRCGKELADAVLESLPHSRIVTSQADDVLIRNDFRYALASFGSLPPLSELKEKMVENRIFMATAKRTGQPPNMEHADKRLTNWFSQAVSRAEQGIESRHVAVPLQVVLICGSVLFITLPFEVFSSTVKKILAHVQSAGYNPDETFVCGYTNGVYGYLTPKNVIKEGGYEAETAYIWYGLPAPYSKRCEEEIITAVTKMIEDLKKIL